MISRRIREERERQSITQAKLAKEAVEQNVTVRELVRAKGILSDEEMDSILDLRAMTDPGVPGKR